MPASSASSKVWASLGVTARVTTLLSGCASAWSESVPPVSFVRSTFAWVGSTRCSSCSTARTSMSCATMMGRLGSATTSPVTVEKVGTLTTAKMSTRSPGRSKPPAPITLSIRTPSARRPSGMMKLRPEPACRLEVSLPARTGSPSRIGIRAI